MLPPLRGGLAASVLIVLLQSQMLYRSLSEGGCGLGIILMNATPTLPFLPFSFVDIIMSGKTTSLLHFFTFLVGGFSIIPQWQVKWWMLHENEQTNQLCATSVKALCYIRKTFRGVMDVVWKHCKQGWMDPQLRWHFKQHSISFKRTSAIKIIGITKKNGNIIHIYSQRYDHKNQAYMWQLKS